MINIKLQVLNYDFSILKLNFLEDADLSKPFSFLSITDEEISLVCPTIYSPKKYKEKDDLWRGFRIEGILDFSLIGILAEISKILAQNKIGIFAVSTFNTDYIFIKNHSFKKALLSLKEHGYEISF